MRGWRCCGEMCHLQLSANLYYFMIFSVKMRTVLLPRRRRRRRRRRGKKRKKTIKKKVLLSLNKYCETIYIYIFLYCFTKSPGIDQMTHRSLKWDTCVKIILPLGDSEVTWPRWERQDNDIGENSSGTRLRFYCISHFALVIYRAVWASDMEFSEVLRQAESVRSRLVVVRPMCTTSIRFVSDLVFSATEGLTRLA